MQILQFPHPLLLQECESVTVFSEELKVILDEMWETMLHSNGIGLAANQVGVLRRMFVMVGPKGEKLYCVNPRIVEMSPSAANLSEGCLSAPGEIITRKDRVHWVQLVFTDETGKPHSRIFRGIFAVCAQHELEHLAGKGFMDSQTLPKKRRLELKKKWGLE